VKQQVGLMKEKLAEFLVLFRGRAWGQSERALGGQGKEPHPREGGLDLGGRRDTVEWGGAGDYPIHAELGVGGLLGARWVKGKTPQWVDVLLKGGVIRKDSQGTW